MVWKTIPGLPMYEASDTGAIRSKARSVRSHIGMKTYRKFVSGKVLEPRLRVTLTDPDEKKVNESQLLIP